MGRMADVRIGVLGRILEGDQKGRIVEVIDDAANTGGWLIFTYADTNRSPEVFDNWVPTRADVDRFFDESGWQIEWLSG
jgi:hypothetical protein